MGLIAAKCTNCGAAIEVDDSKEAGICKFCGTAFITEKVIQNYNYNIDNRTTVNNNIETAYIQNGDSFEELFVKYQSMIKIQNIDMAMKIVDQMYNKFPHVGMVYVVAAHLCREKGKYGIDLAGGNISPEYLEKAEKLLAENEKKGKNKPVFGFCSYTYMDYKDGKDVLFQKNASAFIGFLTDKAEPLLTDEERVKYADFIEDCTAYRKRLFAYAEKVKKYNGACYARMDFKIKRRTKRNRIIMAGLVVLAVLGILRCNGVL